MKKFLVVWALLAAGCAAPREPQLVVYVDTDAVVALGTDPPRGLHAAPNFDQIRFEIMGANGAVIGSGTRDFGVDDRMFREKRVSFGIVPRGPTKLRVRLFRGGRFFGDDPPEGMAIDVIATLPMPDDDRTDRTEVTVFLPTDRVGLGPQSATVSRGQPLESKVATWKPAQPRDCTGDIADGDVCVPGGVFWMGNSLYRGALEERLVAVSPFFLGAHEVTVDEFRAVWPSLSGVPAPDVWSGSHSGNTMQDWCAWTPASADPKDLRGDLPMNCIQWETAEAYCEAIGGALPSEAQFEFAASNRGKETDFPWGDDRPTCSDEVFGRGGYGALALFYDGHCRPVGTMGGAMAPGSAERDVVHVTSPSTGDASDIFDLGANVGEWMLDVWSASDEPFWSEHALTVDPVADVTSDRNGFAHTIKGSDWCQDGAIPAASRVFMSRTGISHATGFRCARSAP